VSRYRTRVAGVAAAVALALRASPAVAQEPPLLTEDNVPVADPRAAGPRAAVVLELVVDKDGHVEDVRVVASAGETLDEAAIAAAWSWTFRPATLEGEPVRAKIRHTVVFEEKALPEAEVDDASALVARARVEAPPREVTKRRLDREELASVAGTRGDSLRAVELLPGVSRPTADGPPVLRGANPYDSQVFLEGAPVANLYHVGGLASFVHSRVLESVELYPSSFSVRYGRKVGGVIEARVRDPRTDGVHGVGEISLLDTSLLAEAPLGEKVAVLAAVRRSHVDLVLRGVDFESLDLTTAPVYWDYQTIATMSPTSRDRVRLLAYGSSDRLGFVLDRPSENDPLIRGAFDAATVSHRAQVGYRHKFDGGSEVNAELTGGHGTERGFFGAIGNYRLETVMLQGRGEARFVLAPKATLIAGVDVLVNHLEGRYAGPPANAGEGVAVSSLSSQRKIGIEASRFISLPGAYAELALRPVPELLVSPGVRVDHNDFIRASALDPRLNARLEVAPETTLKAGVGRFSQSPDERLVFAEVGNPELGMTHAIHVSGGVEQRFGESVTAGVEGFAKWVDDVVVGTPGGVAPYFTNDGRGRIFGGEALLRVRPTGRFFGFVSYTLMRSERREPNATYRLFDRDQPHILSASGVARLGRGWEVGATFRYTSGTPYTPVTSATYDAVTDAYSPRLGPAMSARNPAFSRLDLRVQKTWTFARGSLAAYLDVQNVYNAPNREGFDYGYDYRSRSGTRGLPILPILGLRGEL